MHGQEFALVHGRNHDYVHGHVNQDAVEQLEQLMHGPAHEHPVYPGSGSRHAAETPALAHAGVGSEV